MKTGSSAAIFLTGIMILTASTTMVAQELNQRVFSEGAHREILLGNGNREGMEQEPFIQWFDKEYSSYRLNDSLIKILEGLDLSGLNITIVMGTWCPDSRREVPRFYKITDALHIPDDHIRVIYVDRDKTAPVDGLAALNIERVPTFIFYISGKEAGRIVETPEISLEADMKNILTKN